MTTAPIRLIGRVTSPSPIQTLRESLAVQREIRRKIERLAVMQARERGYVGALGRELALACLDECIDAIEGLILEMERGRGQ